MTVAFRFLTCRPRRGRVSSRDTAGSKASSSPAWAAANASSATDGGVVLPMRSPAPIMSTGKGPQVSSPASRAAPPAAIAAGRHRRPVSVPSCQAKPHWCIAPHASRQLA